MTFAQEGPLNLLLTATLSVTQLQGSQKDGTRLI